MEQSYLKHTFFSDNRNTRKTDLIIHGENTKENNNRVVPLNVIKARLIFSSNVCRVENINFQTFFANQSNKGFVLGEI